MAPKIEHTWLERFVLAMNLPLNDIWDGREPIRTLKIEKSMDCSPDSITINGRTHFFRRGCYADTSIGPGRR